MTAGATGEYYINRGANPVPMAKRKYPATKRNKIEPSVQTLYLPTGSTSSGATTVSYCDLSQIASLVNRRFYRQGINWAVAGFKVVTAEPAPGTNLTGAVIIEKLPNTWVLSNAWQKSMSVWNRMNNEALSETESVKPRFLDFKIYADSAHHTAGFAANLLPAASGGLATPGEWISSKAIVPFGPASPGNTAEFEFIATGGNFPGASASTGFNAVSLIEGYAASRGLPYSPDPNTPADADDADGSTPENWMAAVFNEGTDQTSEVLEDMLFDNNIPPYPFEGDGVTLDTMYPGGANQLPGLQIHDVTSYGATTIGGTTRLKGGNFPCGLIKITHSVKPTSEAHNLVVMIDLVPGTHRGYMCEPMTEM